MIILKIYYRILCYFKWFCYKVIYGKKLKVTLKSTFRKGFHLICEGGGFVVLEDGVFFNNYCTIACQEQITIGEGSIFGENVKIYDHNHCYKDTLIPIKEQGYTSAPIHIGKHCWIASNVVILKGVTIGDNCVIGAGCVIYKDVPEGSVVVNRQELKFV